MGGKWTPIVVSDEHQSFLMTLAGRRYGMAFYCWDDRKLCPDITMTIDQTIVDRLFSMV